MDRALHNSRLRTQKTARTPILQRLARATALLASVIVLAFSFAACGSNNLIPVSIAVTPATATIAAGGMQQFSATGTYYNGQTKNLTFSVTWNSNTPGTA